MVEHRIHVFISHSWRHSHHYETLRRWLRETDWRAGRARLLFCDHSVSRERRIPGVRSGAALSRRLKSKIARCHVVVIPTGIYASLSPWMQVEIELAEALGKPILAVDLRGARRTSTVVSQAAATIVGWRAASVASGIWRLFRDR
ncbi:TIR domain-containing protein [Brevundimonas sp. NPDC092305]|uniref:TIR domain-containing protein n=1 Tax=Brevundimonas sp. NPDC092305 TaxID=3363957 RepID=UPI003817B287